MSASAVAKQPQSSRQVAQQRQPQIDDNSSEVESHESEASASASVSFTLHACLAHSSLTFSSRLG